LPDIKHIEVDPERLGGRPTSRDRRLPADKVGELAQTPEGRKTLIEDYELNHDEIEDAARWYEAVSRYAAAA